MKNYISHDVKETEFIGYQLGQKSKSGEIYALFGGLGMGKTAFTRGFAKGLMFNGDVSSPTFALVNEYIGGRLPLFHFDMYRVNTFEDLYSTGFFDYMDRGGVFVIEWSENIESALPEDCKKIYISKGDEENDRIIKVI
jgi:tRNA threonylcarbamoyladenosine biosynthesis protein TsaE